MATANPLDFNDDYIIRRTDLRRFILISFVLHAVVLIMHGLLPTRHQDTEVKEPVKIKYVPPAPPQKAKKRSTLIDAPEPQKVEAPRTSELLSSFNSRAHSDKPAKKAKRYQSTKTTAPKVTGSRASANRAKARAREPQKQVAPPVPDKKEMRFPISDKGFIVPIEKPKETPKVQQPEAGVGSARALLDGFDASKYAKVDTGDKADAGDDEVISLDTKETKYASYFARIKHQIERVWDYPEEAARKGISGELTLRFQIQRDGDLMEVRLVEGSGHEVLDFAALRAIKNAAPFYPFPVTIDRDKISILATFVYSPSYGAMHRRR